MTPQPDPSPADRDLVVALTPFGEPHARIVLAAERAGALGLLDLGRDAEAAGAALAELAGPAAGAGRPHGVRVPVGCPLGPDDLPPGVDTVLLADPAALDALPAWAAGGTRRVWAEVVSLEEALAARDAGVTALVAKGHEAGGRVGGTTTFVLLQQLLDGPGAGLPVLAYGGIGEHTAAAAVAGGAAGVVLDAQLALTAEGEAVLPGDVAAALRAMDGSETAVVDGHRVYARPDLDPDRHRPDLARRLGARGLHRQPLPVGQDGACAARLAARYRTTGGVVQAVRRAVAGHLAAAVRADVLRPREGDGHLPVAQGPMTRVSDRAAFAAAVAAAGGVPYLALAVMEGPEVRELLAETARLLGGRPWGVGLLGFAPPELRAAQLAAVAEVRPPYAVVAGGSPAQAAPLEAAGTRTHLHVPSPGLLERYLAEGARRFVFEGLECGGHIGPRASFPLWEEQIDRLLACDDVSSLDLLFAGGIHDARSAAMAAAAAAPLAERGARVGVLMGTAYLFTEEAVAAGAVLPGFQRAALECARTVTLHTAPGHVTRCAESPYTETFAATRRALEEGGAAPREVWEELERLNLGRLRIASKGLRHGADGPPVPVPEAEQARDGLFMLGQAAVLRGRTTTLAALHREVTEGAADLLAGRDRALRAAARPAPAPEPLDVAVVGMACAYPGAPDLAAYWSQVLAGADAVTEVPADRWDPALHYDADPARAGERTPSRWGGFLPPVPFDALAHGIPPASLSGIEPVQLLALEIAARALADAGYGPDRAFDRSRTSVVFGAEAGTELAGAYGFRALYPGYLGELPPGLDAQLLRLTEDSFPGVLANVIAGRIANRLDLGGANCTVDAACASSLAALDLACRQLRDGDSDMVLCGGADVHNGINDYLLFASVRALSPTGRCRPFDASADGIALGEGVAAVVLKRLADAERDGDRVYAVVKAVGSASDGRSLGLTAPRPEGQRRALERAYAKAGIEPGQVGLVEAHGTGTVVGDGTELAVLTELFGDGERRAGTCGLGSVKSQIGHTKCAAGLAGLIKAARAVHAGVRPPTLHLERPNPAWRAESSPFFFDGEARPWAVPAGRRVAGVSAFGFGGTNYHAVLAGHEGGAEPAHGLELWPAELFCFAGADREAAARSMARLAARLEENDAVGRPWALRDLAAEVAEEAAVAPAGPLPVQVAVVAADLDDLAARLERARAFEPGEGVHVRAADAGPGRLAFLFPGQGSQRPGMLGDLFVAFPALRGLLDTAPEAVTAAMFPPAAFSAEERAEQRAAVTDTRVAQPALGLAGAAAHRLLTSLGVRPDCTAGHSYGELTALWAAGVFDTEALLRLSAVRAGAILEAAGEDPGAMAAVTAEAGRVRETAERAGCVVANHNAPRQCVVSGPTAAVEEVVAALRAEGLAAERLPVACAFHSEVVAGAAGRLASELAGTVVVGSAVPVWSNTTAGPYGSDPARTRELLARQVAEPVRFVDQVEAMYAAGVRTFVEVGPGRVLTGLVGRILGDRPHTAVAVDVPGEHGLRQLLTALAELAVAGVPVDPGALFRGRTRVLPRQAPRRPGWLVDGHLVRTAGGEPVPGGLGPARRVEGAGASGVPAAGAGDGRDGAAGYAAAREGAVLAYLRGTRELVAAQREVLLGYLGVADGAGGARGAERAAGWVREDGEAVAREWPPGGEVVPGGGPGAVPVGGPGAVPGGLPGGGPVGLPGGVDRVAASAGRGSPYGPGSEPGGAGSGAGAGPVGALGAAELLDAVLEIVHVRTGYPRDMLDPDLDLEADLSVDSIKRVEIIGALADRVGLPQEPGGGTESAVEELSRIKTIRGVVEWITSRGGPAASAPEPPVGGASPGLPGAPALPMAAGTAVTAGAAGPAYDSPAVDGVGTGDEGGTGPAPLPLRRYVVQVAPAGPPPAAEPERELTGGLFGVVEDGSGVAPALAALLARHGARAVVLAAERLTAAPGAGTGVPALEELDGLVDLTALRSAPGPVLPGTFPGLRRVLTGRARRLLLVTGSGGSFGRDTAGGPDPLPGAGLRGFARSAALEFPGTLVRAVDVDPKERPEHIAAQLLAELCAAGEPVAVGYRDGERRVLRTVEAPLADTPARVLGPDSVVLFTGGARGITARTALVLARATGCRIELVGRTPAPSEGGEDPALARAGDRVALRAALIARGLRTPAEIEAAASRVLADREVRATLAALSEVAGSVRYHCADVAREESVRALVADVRARYGRLDGIVHGAGVLRDGLLAEKEPAAFAEVFAVKVDGARHLAAAAAEHGTGPAPAFLALFGSVAGVHGNRGQADYAAANDALDTLAHAWSAAGFPGRVLTLDWGPWAAESGGMVTPELERAYARRGIPLIHPEAGTAAFLAELEHGTDPQVLLLAPDVREEGRADG
ncbi:SDR family NAD(P)-dependent oxidoreductase [Streptomyces sp. NPDC101118]|uniref:SDR family NAD(P)-dependent oxidoreductase n=1 Tax=Streptomyces sp. NPDC101118 TaxID=3366109 RepID=UPI00380854B8